uniref:adhesion G protein-coupled receptor L2-like isoform X3 n=1 Tax=Ciona intestinalis TaxID=7719 RepID=UPI000EF44656|nr:adhesion G protein-coupled receptor L2-like isoform X3 [Ciona intestinalis]|eukprot:XP_026692839.1 adhesion G protein-coupled receptor L2-like isoform X3 [Ciona intestinalis]
MSYRFFILHVVVLVLVEHGNSQTYDFMNSNETVRYRIYSERNGFRAASALCTNSYNGSLLMIKNETQAQDAIALYRQFASQTGMTFGLNAWHGLYWSNVSWTYIDGTEPGSYSQWRPDFNAVAPTSFCSVLFFPAVTNTRKRRSLERLKRNTGVTLFWGYERCDQIKTIICQRKVPKPIPTTTALQPVLVTQAISTNKTFSQLIEKLTANVQNPSAVCQTDNQINRFQNLSQTPDVQVSLYTMKNALKIANSLKLSIQSEPNCNVSAVQKYEIVNTLRSFALKVEIPNIETQISLNESDVSVQVLLHSNLISRERYLNITFGDIWVRIPVNEIRQRVNYFRDPIRIVYIAYQDSTLFDTDLHVTQVITANVNEQILIPLISPIYFRIPIPKTSNKETQWVRCARWKPGNLTWSFEGCLTSISEGYVLCECRDLTHLSVVVRRSTASVKTPQFTVACKLILLIGIVALLSTLVFYTICDSLRTSLCGPIYINLFATQLVAYITFIVGIDLIQYNISCDVVAAIVQNFILNAWVWLLLEAFALFRLLVMKCSSFENNFLLKASLASYLFPAVIVAVNVGLTSALHSHETDHITDWIAIKDEHELHHSLYTSQYFCFLHSNSLYFGFILEIVFVLVSTVAAYLYIVYKLTNTEESQETADPAINDRSKFYLVRAVTNCLSMAVCWLLIVPVALTSQDERFRSITTYIFTIYASFHCACLDLNPRRKRNYKTFDTS